MVKIKNVLIALCFLPGYLSAAASLPECTQKNAVVTVTAKDPEFTVRLASNPTTGYRWFLQETASDVVPLSAQFVKSASGKGVVGAGGEEVWGFKVTSGTVPRQYTLHFVYARPFDPTHTESFRCRVFALAAG